MPETLELVRRLRTADTKGLSGSMVAALGTPPSVTEVDALGEGERIPRRWGEVYDWSLAMPPDVLAAWQAAIEVCRVRWGEPNANGAMLPPAVATFVSQDSPYPQAELEQLSPIDAARRVAEWAPDPDRDFGSSPGGLAAELQKIIEKDPEPWLTTGAAEIVRTLDRPVYLLSYFSAIRARSEVALPEFFLEAVEETVTLYVRDRDSRTVDYAGPSWASVLTSAVGSLHRVDLTQSATQTRAWVVLQRMADLDESADPTGPTIYASAILAAISITDALEVSGVPPAELGDLLEAALHVPRPLAEAVRSAIAANLNWLVYRFPSWTEQHWELLVGDSAPDRLGAFTFEQYLARSRPYDELLRRCREQMWAAMKTTPMTAQGHILSGMLRGIEGYEPATVLERMSALSNKEVSDAARRLATAMQNSESLDFSIVRTFWVTALEAHLPAEEYEGFGYFALAESVDEGEWLRLTLAAAQQCTSGLEMAGQVARRAALQPNEPGAVRLLAALLKSKLEDWEIFDIGLIAVGLLRTTEPTDAEARDELRERLLENEFYEARDL
jgi:hypothetical protein